MPGVRPTATAHQPDLETDDTREASRGRSLAGAYPHIFAELHPTRNGKLAAAALPAGSGRKLWWRCERGHDWQARVYDRCNGTGCPICVGDRAVHRARSLLDARLDLVAELHPTRNGDLDPQLLAAHSNFKIWWLCPNGHEWLASVAARSRGSGCPSCVAARPVPEGCSLAHRCPELAAEWHPTRNGELDPGSVTPGSSWKVWWRCRFGHEWQAVVSKRTAGTGCPVCRRTI